MTPAQRLCALGAVMLVLAVPACHRRLPRPGKPTAAQPARRASPAPAPPAPSPAPPAPSKGHP